MQKRKIDELIAYFNRKVSDMDIEMEYKMELLGMITAIGFACEKEFSVEPEPHWIPCSERLPKMGQHVIDNYASLNWLSFCSDGREWVFQRPGEIISWYPLPEPYKEGEQE